MRRATIIGMIVTVVVIGVFIWFPGPRYKVIAWLGSEPVADGMPASYWVRIARQSEDEDRKSVALDKLVELSSEFPLSADTIRLATNDSNPKIRAKAVHFLGILDDSVASPEDFARFLKDEDGQVRAEAATALGAVQSVDDTMLEIIKNQAKTDPFPRARLAAIMSLAGFGERVSEMIPFLIQTLEEPDSQSGSAHGAAVLALAKICRENPAKLLDSHQKLSPRIQSGLMQTLASMGTSATKVLPDLRIILANSPEPTVRLEAALAFWKISGKSEEPMLVVNELLGYGHSDDRKRVQVQCKASFLVVEMGVSAAAAGPKLISILKTDPSHHSRKYAAMALGKIGKSPEVLEALREAAKTDKDPDVCWAANEALKDK